MGVVPVTTLSTGELPWGAVHPRESADAQRRRSVTRGSPRLPRELWSSVRLRHSKTQLDFWVSPSFYFRSSGGNATSCKFESVF